MAALFSPGVVETRGPPHDFYPRVLNLQRRLFAPRVNYAQRSSDAALQTSILIRERKCASCGASGSTSVCLVFILGELRRGRNFAGVDLINYIQLLHRAFRAQEHPVLMWRVRTAYADYFDWKFTSISNARLYMGRTSRV